MILVMERNRLERVLQMVSELKLNTTNSNSLALIFLLAEIQNDVQPSIVESNQLLQEMQQKQNFIWQPSQY